MQSWPSWRGRKYLYIWHIWSYWRFWYSAQFTGHLAASFREIYHTIFSEVIFTKAHVFHLMTFIVFPSTIVLMQTGISFVTIGIYWYIWVTRHW
jgi:hypothetical protein